MAKNSYGGAYTPMPATNDIGRLYGMVEIGTQLGFDPSKPKTKQEVWMYEFPDLLMEDGRPWKISEFVTVADENGMLKTQSDSTFMKRIIGWLDQPAEKGKACTFPDGKGGVTTKGFYWNLPKDFDSFSYLGSYGRIVVSNNGTKAKVETITPLSPKGVASKNVSPAGVNPLLSFRFDDPDALVKFSQLPPFLRTKIAASPEWALRLAQAGSQQAFSGKGEVTAKGEATARGEEPIDLDKARGEVAKPQTSAEASAAHVDDIPF